MATYINNNVKFHAFSKSPVSPDTTLGGAVNPSGHTITTSQVRAQDIPAFLNTFAGSKQDAITWLGTNYATPAHNDIAYYGGEFKAGFDTPKCLKYNGKTSTWEDFDLKYTDRANSVLRTTLKNADDKDVLAIHQDCSTVFVDGGNNAATNSNRWSLFVKKSDGSILDHFVASTDKIVAGMPSLGYNALVMLNNAAIDEGELDANYVGNTFAGIIHLNKQYDNGDDSKFKVTCFEYIGEKLDESITAISDSVKDIINTTMQGVVASVGATTAATAAGISVDSSVTTSPKIDLTTGSVTSGETKLVSGGTVASAIDTAVKITGIQVKVGSGTAQTLTPTNKVVTIEIPEVQAAVVSGGEITTDGFAKASDAKAIAEKAISTSLAGTTDGTIGKAIATAKSGAEQTAATALSTARGEITTEIGTAVSGLESKLTTGEGSLGAKVAALETATGTTLPAAIEQALTDAKAYSDSLHTTSLDYVVLGDSESLPTASADTLGKIYLVASQNTTAADGAAISGAYVEYMTRKIGDGETATYTWEKIGTTEADLYGYAKSVTINGYTYTASAANAGVLNLGTVVSFIAYGNDDSKGVSPDNQRSIQAFIADGGGLYLGIASAADSVMGVSKMFTGNYWQLPSTATDTAVSTLTASAMFSNIDAKLDDKADANNVVNSINGAKGEIKFCVHNGVSNPSSPIGWEGEGSGSATTTHANLWGTGIYTSQSTKNIAIVDSFVGLPWAYDNYAYLQLAALPSDAVTVENNFVMNASGKVITTIRPERMYSGFSAQAAKGLKSFVGDLPNLTTATYGDGDAKRTFYECTALESFIGDLSSLENGDTMFCGCSKLTTFISDLSSLTDGHGMFYNCNLDAESLECIAETLPTVTSGEISIGYGCSAADAEACKTAIEAKGWTCTMRYNG